MKQTIDLLHKIAMDIDLNAKALLKQSEEIEEIHAKHSYMIASIAIENVAASILTVISKEMKNHA